MTAAYRLKGLGWFGTCTAIVLGFYLVSLQVASERKRLEHLDADIAATRRDIRALETEFDTRANLAQLERWNGDTLALAAPVPAQFLRSEAELASVAVVRPPAAPAMRAAALVVPSFVAAPATPALAVAAAVPVPAPPPARAAVPERPHPVLAVATATPVGAGVRPAEVVRRAAQVALLDRKLLSDSTLRDLLGGARAEGGKLR